MKISIHLLTLTLAAFSTLECVAQTDSEYLTAAISDIERSKAIIDAVWQTSIKGSSTTLYMADTYDTVSGATSGASDVWPYTAAIEAHCSFLEALEAIKDYSPELYDANFSTYRARLDNLIYCLDYYKGSYRLSSYATSNKLCSPYAVPRASIRGGANVSGILNVYDDQMWIARELIRAYRVTGTESYLTRATELVDYVLEGWDCWRDADGNEYGGITWGPGYNSKHACSNAPVIQPLVWLSEIYSERPESMDYYYRTDDNSVTHSSVMRSDHYLDFARRIYDWQKRHLANNTGIYYDMMGADNTIQISRGYRQHVDCGEKTGSFFSYNTGTMLAGAAEIYRLTSDTELLSDIESTSRGAMNQFSRYVRAKNTYEFSTDETAESGFNTWFNNVLMRAYVDAAPYESTYTARALKSFQNNLDYAFDNFRRKDALLPIHLLDGWGSETLTKGFHQMAFASEYAILAIWQLSRHNAAAIDHITTDDTDPDDTVYTLSGIRLGHYSEVVSSLSPGLYISKGRKILIK